MIGWFVLISAVIAMYRITDTEGKNGALWGFITFLICFGSLFIPLPLLNIFIGFIVSFLVYFIYKVVRNE